MREVSQTGDDLIFAYRSISDRRYTHLHEVTDVFPVGQYLAEVLCAQYVAQGRLSEQPCGAVHILDIGY